MALFGSLQCGGNIQFLTANAGIHSRNSDGSITRRMTFPDWDGTHAGTPPSYAGVLHGSWLSDHAITSSDRRLKTDIIPLHQTLLSRMSQVQGEKVKDVASRAGGLKKKTRREAVDWVLRELRPVSFTFKTGIDAKTMQ